MGLFSRAISAALRSAGRSHTEAARLSGLTQASISRSASGETLPDPANLSKLLLAIEPADRPHCLRQYLMEHTPDEYHGHMDIIISGTKESAPGHIDDLSAALLFLDKEANRNKHLETLLIELALTLSGQTGEELAKGPQPLKSRKRLQSRPSLARS